MLHLNHLRKNTNKNQGQNVLAMLLPFYPMDFICCDGLFPGPIQDVALCLFVQHIYSQCCFFSICKIFSHLALVS